MVYRRILHDWQIPPVMSYLYCPVMCARSWNVTLSPLKVPDLVGLSIGGFLSPAWTSPDALTRRANVCVCGCVPHRSPAWLTKWRPPSFGHSFAPMSPSLCLLGCQPQLSMVELSLMLLDMGTLNVSPRISKESFCSIDLHNLGKRNWGRLSDLV